jgi:pilus assembly protein CpaF
VTLQERSTRWTGAVGAVGAVGGGGADDLDATVTLVTDRVADRLIEAIEHDDSTRSSSRAAGVALAGDERRQQVLVGGWIVDEMTSVNEMRLQRGARPLSQHDEHQVRARVVADLTGAGPLEPFLSDPMVEEIDVNGPDSTWVTYTDGRKVDVGRLWASAADLTMFQKRMALRMSGTGEGRLDTSSPMLTLQSRDGARIVMVLGGSGEHGVSTHPGWRSAASSYDRSASTVSPTSGCSPTHSSPGCEPWCAAASPSSCPVHRVRARRPC